MTPRIREEEITRARIQALSAEGIPIFEGQVDMGVVPPRPEEPYDFTEETRRILSKPPIGTERL
ncbi:MAG: hypothetical protein M1379_14095 [Firmicutes bacterium]|nr:hypothetical protein [Bacillota bacterium]